MTTSKLAAIRRSLRLCLCALALLAPLALRAAPEQKKLAVLEFAVELADKAAIDRLYFASRVQGAVRSLLPAEQFFIMTRESLQEILRAQGKTLEECQGNCEVETGRLLSADLVVSGRITRVGARFKLALTLHQVVTGQLLGTAFASGETAEKLDDDIPTRVEELIASLIPAAQKTPGQTGTARPKAQQQAFLFVGSKPDGVLIKLDGQIVGPAPLTMPLKPGRYLLEGSLPGYLPQTREVQVSLADEQTKVQFSLDRLLGKLSIASNASCSGTAGETQFSVSGNDMVLLKLPTGPVQIKCNTSDGRSADASATVSVEQLASANLRFSAPAPVQARRDEPASSGPSGFSVELDRRLQKGLTWSMALGMGSLAAPSTEAGFGMALDFQLRLVETLFIEAGFQFHSKSGNTAWRLGALAQPFMLGPIHPYGGVRLISDGDNLGDAYGAVAGLGIHYVLLWCFEYQRGVSGWLNGSNSYMVVMRFPEGF